MADADHSPAFWHGVASRFKNDPAVIFELYNAPHDITWSCWRNGCRTSGGWRAVGMQQLLDAVRSTGATNVVLAGGIGWSSNLSQWLMTWADQHGVSYLAWTWDTWDCGSGPALIANYDGTPTAYGAVVRDHFVSD